MRNHEQMRSEDLKASRYEPTVSRVRDIGPRVIEVLRKDPEIETSALCERFGIARSTAMELRQKALGKTKPHKRRERRP